MCLRRKKKGKSKVLSSAFHLRDSEAEQMALQFLHIYYSKANRYSSAPKSNKQNPPPRTLDLPYSFRYKLATSLENVPSPTPSESLPYWFQYTEILGATDHAV